MIIEHEILEQISDDKPWGLPQVLEFVSKHKEPWGVVSQLFNDNCIQLQNERGQPLESYEVQRLFKTREREQKGIFVSVTKAGLARVFP
jgi:hypothetical protein